MSDTSDRSQSSIDFVLGFGVFFLTLTFVIALLPELLSPYAGPDGAVVADRAVETLAGDLLASGTVGTLDGRCTEEFFDRSGDTCFDASDPTAALVGVSDTDSLNVTLEANVSGGPATEILCYSGSDLLRCGDGGDPLARGPLPPSGSGSVAAASRVVRLDGRTVWLKLRVW